VDELLVFYAENTLGALILAMCVYAVTRVWRHPPVVHVLWLLVLFKLVAPPLVGIDWPAVTPTRGLRALPQNAGRRSNSPASSRRRASCRAILGRPSAPRNSWLSPSQSSSRRSIRALPTSPRAGRNRRACSFGPGSRARPLLPRLPQFGLPVSTAGCGARSRLPRDCKPWGERSRNGLVCGDRRTCAMSIRADRSFTAWAGGR
jgi:hypothetical protein